MAIHVFFDNSNIWGGAQATRSVREPRVPWVALRLQYENLFRLMEGGRDRMTAELAGSVPPECEALWIYARRHGYRTNLLQKVENDAGRWVEQAVDEVLHMKIANVLLDYPSTDTLVVATGDGRLSTFGTGFRTQVERALKHGWNVEVWSFSEAYNDCYDRLMKEFPGRLQSKMLDNYYDCVTFVQKGEYYEKDAAGNRVYFDVPARYSKSL
jgi:hypothetical protein